MFPWNKISRSYEGPVYKKASEWWLPWVWINKETPIKYLEVGVFYGIHLFEVAKYFTNAHLHGVDPWLDYDNYSEYKTNQNQILHGFQRNLERCPDRERIQIHRGFSDDIVPTFEDNFFDIIFVDGNHETDFVYRDGCMSFQKCKPGGYIIFDDYDWPETQVGIDKFLEEYKDKIDVVVSLYYQYIIKKL